MKKKIKDLTVEEFEKICDKNLNNNCETCPLKKFHSCIGIVTYIATKRRDYLNEEIEVEDDE